MKMQIQFQDKFGIWQNLGKPREEGWDFTEWWNAHLKGSLFNLKDKYGVKLLRALDENGNITHGIGSKSYNEFVEIQEGGAS